MSPTISWEEVLHGKVDPDKVPPAAKIYFSTPRTGKETWVERLRLWIRGE